MLTFQEHLFQGLILIDCFQNKFYHTSRDKPFISNVDLMVHILIDVAVNCRTVQNIKPKKEYYPSKSIIKSSEGEVSGKFCSDNESISTILSAG